MAGYLKSSDLGPHPHSYGGGHPHHGHAHGPLGPGMPMASLTPFGLPHGLDAVGFPQGMWGKYWFHLVYFKLNTIRWHIKRNTCLGHRRSFLKRMSRIACLLVDYSRLRIKLVHHQFVSLWHTNREERKMWFNRTLTRPHSEICWRWSKTKLKIHERNGRRLRYITLR